MALHRFTNACLVDCGLTADQFVVLASIAEHGPMTQTELTQRTFSDPNTISAMLSLLHDLGCVARKRHKTDGRVRVVSLTRRGRTMFNKCSMATDEIRQRLARELEAGNLDQFIASLNGVAELLQNPNSTSQEVESMTHNQQIRDMTK
ncbi:MAG: MarR family transcriptional regulator [Planctomycetales bacterium]|nr:MarR family transcriptional regulator [Planctomycetales bacterium]